MSDPTRDCLHCGGKGWYLAGDDPSCDAETALRAQLAAALRALAAISTLGHDPARCPHGGPGAEVPFSECACSRFDAWELAEQGIAHVAGRTWYRRARHSWPYRLARTAYGRLWYAARGTYIDWREFCDLCGHDTREGAHRVLCPSGPEYRPMLANDPGEGE